MKVKINLASGNVTQKPLVTCFKNGNGSYIVFDNEANGAMGLPIIAISRFNDNEAIKIVDQAEWTAVKESLKSIIANGTIEYLPVAEEISAQDDFFTQLTLPVASFDVLKSNYVLPTEPVIQSQEEPVIEEATVAEDTVSAVMSDAITIPSVEEVQIESEPVIASPEVTPAFEPIQENADLKFPMENENNDIAQIKENFLNSCETMFDALVQKIQSK